MQSVTIKRISETHSSADSQPASNAQRNAIRVLMATPEPCPTFRADITTLFGKYLPRFGVYSDVVTERATGCAGEVNWGGGKGFLSSGRGGKAAKHFIRLAHCTRIMLRADRSRYQAIQVRDMPLIALVGLLAARVKRLPFFYWMSFPMPEGQIALARGRGLSGGLLRFLFPWVRGHAGRFLLYRIVLPLADHVFVQSERMREDVATKGLPMRKMTSVPMGVDAELMRPEDIAPSVDPRLAGRRVLVYLGSLDRNRRIDSLFQMLQIVRRKFPSVLLALVGEADDEAHERWLKLRAEQMGVMDAILWTGWLPIHEAWTYVRAAEIGLSPIPRGPLLDVSSPTKAPEYLALGVPVVGNDSPDQRRVLEESGGGICVWFGAEQFADAVCRLLSDERLRHAMASSGQRYVRAHRSYGLLAEHLASRYASLLRMPASGTGRP